MQEDFEERYELSVDDEKILPILVEYMNEVVGEENSATSGEICSVLNEFITWDGSFNAKYSIKPVKVRMLIHAICLRRLTTFPLLSGTKGYYISNDINAANNHINSLSNRIKSIANRLESIKQWTQFNTSV
jgi:flagellar capping protein FliD